MSGEASAFIGSAETLNFIKGRDSKESRLVIAATSTSNGGKQSLDLSYNVESSADATASALGAFIYDISEGDISFLEMVAFYFNECMKGNRSTDK